MFVSKEEGHKGSRRVKFLILATSCSPLPRGTKKKEKKKKGNKKGLRARTVGAFTFDFSVSSSDEK